MLDEMHMCHGSFILGSYIIITNLIFNLLDIVIGSTLGVESVGMLLLPRFIYFRHS